MIPLLTIGTDDDRIDLLNVWCLDDWTPNAGGTEDVFGSSRLADYRQLTSYREITTRETLRLKLARANADNAIYHTQELRRMIRKAKDYWAAASNDVPAVYLAARASCETNTRYAVVHNAELPTDDNPYGQPFLQATRAAVLDDLTLIIERGAWLENPPGTGTAVEISGMYSTYGRAATTAAGEVFIANKNNTSQITHVYYYDLSAFAWSGNLYGAAKPTQMLPAAPAVGDMIFFGISPTASGPFNSLVFDIDTPMIGAGLTGQWSYWNGGWHAFAANELTDLTTNFTLSGVRSVHFKTSMGDWAPNDPGMGVTGWWVRWEITGGAGITHWHQANRDIYTVTWASVLVDDLQVPGDIPALLRYRLYSRGSKAAQLDDFNADRVIVGARSTDRGANFVAYINLSNEQNPAGITVTYPAGGHSSAATTPVAVTRNWVLYNPGGIHAFDDEIVIDFANTIAHEYAGTYHVFLRCVQAGGAAGQVGARALFSAIGVSGGATDTYSETDYTEFVGGGMLELLDLGRMTFPSYARLPGDVIDASHIIIQLCALADVDLNLTDLILIPVDEFAGEAVQNLKSTNVNTDEISVTFNLDVDGVRYPEQPLCSLRYADEAYSYYIWIANNWPRLRENKEQRLWFLSECPKAAAWPIRQSNIYVSFSPLVYRTARYLSMRGGR